MPFEAAIKQLKELRSQNRRIHIKVPPDCSEHRTFVNVKRVVEFIEKCKADPSLTTSDPSVKSAGLPVKVNVSGATNLPHPEKGRPADVKVTVEVKGKPETIQESPVIYTSVNPLWEPPFKMAFTDYVDGESILFKIWDVYPCGREKLLGTAEVKYAEFSAQEKAVRIPELC
jgi:hypothetical protein